MGEIDRDTGDVLPVVERWLLKHWTLYTLYLSLSIHMHDPMSMSLTKLLTLRVRWDERDRHTLMFIHSHVLHGGIISSTYCT